MYIIDRLVILLHTGKVTHHDLIGLRMIEHGHCVEYDVDYHSRLEY